MKNTVTKKPPTEALREILRPGYQAFKAYWRLFLSIQVVAAVFVIAYYQFSSVRSAVGWLRELQSSGGLWFAAATNILSGAIIPELAKLKFRAAVEKPITWGDFAFRCLLMALSGVMVFYFYLLQDHLFGSGIDALTLLKKILFDQLAFAPLVAIPFIVGMFILHENKYSWVNIRQNVTLQNYKSRILSLWATALSFWPVMLIVIYAMPADMQFILFLFANAAFCLVMMLVASNGWSEEA
ncbi:MAG: hypothetical protein ACPGN3_08195 [Opitutales bacterium]